MELRKKIKFQSAKKAEQTLSVPTPDWSLLPPELLKLISECLGDSFDASIHARSVCNSWRSTFTYPSSVLSRTTYSIPSFDKFPSISRDFCILQNFPVYLFVTRDPASLHSEFFIGGIVRENHVQLPSPTSINMCDYHIVPLGRQYRMVRYDNDSRCRALAFLPLTKKGGEEFVVLLCYSNVLRVSTSAEMKWKRLDLGSTAQCSDIVTFRGRFYALLVSNELFIIDPYSQEVTPLLPPLLELEDYVIESSYLVPSGDDELFLVEQIIPRNTRLLCLDGFVTKVSRLDEETGKWVIVSDLGDRVLLIGPPGNRTCSGKDLPDGCGLSGNSMLFTGVPGGTAYPFKYGVDTRHEEDYLDLNYWRPTRQNRVTILSASSVPAHMKSRVVALRVER